MSPAFKAVNRCMGKALHRYEMIAGGDRIAVGLSGGADSMTLLFFLHERLRRIPVTYELYPVYIDPGFEGGFADRLAEWTDGMDLPLRVEMTAHGPCAHSIENRENPCFLCSRLRRKRLFEITRELGCRKLALGHNKDDIIETLFLNLCYAGEMSTMKPVQPLFSGAITLIRPLALCEAGQIRTVVRRHGLPVFQNPCPSAGTSRRRQIRDWLADLYRSNPKIRGNIFRAMRNVNPEYLP